MLLSIIIPVYNLESYIENSLNSVLTTNLDNFEIICVNDGSTDSSLDIINSFVSKRLRVISVENGGVSNARNIGLSNAKGKYILFLDGDDYMITENLLKLLNILHDSNSDVICCNYYESYNIGDEAILSNRSLIKNNSIIIDKNHLFAELFINKNLNIWTGSVLISRNTLLSKKIMFDTKLTNGEDLNFFYKVLFSSDVVQIESLYISSYLQRETSISYSNNFEKFCSFYAIRSVGDFLDPYLSEEQANYFRNELSFLTFVYTFTFFLKSCRKRDVLNSINKEYPELLTDIESIDVGNFLLKKNKYKIFLFKFSPIAYKLILEKVEKRGN